MVCAVLCGDFYLGSLNGLGDSAEVSKRSGHDEAYVLGSFD